MSRNKGDAYTITAVEADVFVKVRVEELWDPLAGQPVAAPRGVTRRREQQQRGAGRQQEHGGKGCEQPAPR